MIEALRSLRIGYVPYTSDLSGPGDRRRFPFYARLRELPFEVHRPGERYDLVVISTLADLTAWSRHPHDRTRLVFDMPDGYFAADPHRPTALIRGTTKFLLGRHSHWEPSYHKTLERLCRRVDAVTCSSPEQRAMVLPHNANTHAILDFHEREMRSAKSSWTTHERLNLVWEGLGGNVFTFDALAEPLTRAAARRPLALHLITDLAFKPFNGPVPRRQTLRLVRKLLPGLEVNLYQWHRDTFAAIAAACDLALIPIPLSRPLYRAKPENKLLIFWRLGLPVLTSPTPAYTRTMASAGIEGMTCQRPDDWTEAIVRFGQDEAARQDAGQRGRAFALHEYGVDALARRWDACMASLFPSLIQPS